MRRGKTLQRARCALAAVAALAGVTPSYAQTQGMDRRDDRHGDLETIPYLGLMLGYTHHWAERWRSAVSGGYVHLDNTASQAGDAYHQTVYASANLIFQYHRRLSIGVEALYGHKESKDGSDGDVARITAALVYTIFD